MDSMPKQTFFNLPDEKRNQIIAVAIDEFADNDYDNASVSRIVARAGIAKGSLYQYFENKEDLYGYLLGLLAEAKTQFLSLDHPDPQHIGIFTYLRWTVQAGLAFELAYPKLTRIGIRANNTSNLPEGFATQMREATRTFYRRLVEAGKQDGDIAGDIDSGLAAVVFEALMDTAGRYIVNRLESEGIGASQDTRLLMEQPEVAELFNQTVTILEYGMRRRPQTPGGE